MLARYPQVPKSSSKALMSFDLSSIADALPGPTYKLRDYQVEAVENILRALKNGISRPAVVLATGGGKTVVLAHTIPRIEGANPLRSKTLVLAHKEELVRQAAKTIRDVNPDLKVDIDMSKSKPSADSDVIVGSVPTLVRMSRLGWYKPDEFKAIVLDECHHATAGSWTKILGYFNALEDPDIPVLGFTATFERSDGVALGNVFQEVVYERNLFQMIKNGELCDARFLTMKVDLDLTDVKVSGGDFMASKLTEVMNKENINLQVSLAYKTLQKEHNLKSTLVFCVDVEHCKALCGVLQANGVNAQYVTGNTVKHERRAILEDFKAGKIQVLCNVLVFTEGTDIPNIDSLILARPTKSRPLLTQMVGRGLRLHKGKDYCHIIDLAGTMKVGVSSIPCLFGLPDSHDFSRKTYKELEEEKKRLDDAALQASANARTASVEQILSLQKEAESWSIGFDSVDGFASMFNHMGLVESDDLDDVLQEFRSNHHFWIRLRYDIWGLPLGTSNNYLCIEREPKEKSFMLFQVTVTTHFRRQASSYQIRNSKKTEISSGSLSSLLATASNIARNHMLNFKLDGRPVTTAQANYVTSLLKNKIINTYGEDAVKTFRNEVGKISMERVSNLIFSSKYSVNSLWTQWELRKMLGPTPEDEAKKTRLEEKIRKLESSSPVSSLSAMP